MKKIKVNDMLLAKIEDCDKTFHFHIVSSIIISSEKYFIAIKAFFEIEDVVVQVYAFDENGVSI